MTEVTKKLCAHLAALLASTALLLVPAVGVAESGVRDVEAAHALAEQVKASWKQSVAGARAFDARAVDARPDTGTGPIGMNYGSTPASYLDGGPLIRVWYVESGQHAVAPEDLDGNGRPDFVEFLAEKAEEIAEAFVDDGWLRPLSDEGRGLPNHGGDGRFDIYLLDFGGGADGVFVREFCEGSPERCGGYIAIENDFVGYSYASVEDALQTLFSHEYAHAVGAAYFAGAATWWDEGFATWAEYPYGDVEDDVVRLANRWFRTPSESLDDSTNPGSSWPYAASAFVMDLALRHGSALPRRVFERLAEQSSRSAPGALEEELVSRGETLAGAWLSFGARGWFTGVRANDVEDVWNAARMASYPVEAIGSPALPMRLDAKTWSVRPVALDGGVEAATWEPCSDREQASLVVVGIDGTQTIPTPSTTIFAVDPLDTLLVVGRPRVSAGLCGMLVGSDAPLTPACELDDSCDDDEEPQQPEPPSEGTDEEVFAAGGGCSSGGGLPSFWLALSLFLTSWRRRRYTAAR